jgi:K+ transporter
MKHATSTDLAMWEEDFLFGMVVLLTWIALILKAYIYAFLSCGLDARGDAGIASLFEAIWMDARTGTLATVLACRS